MTSDWVRLCANMTFNPMMCTISPPNIILPETQRGHF